ncbi:MAG: ATP-binding protein [Bacteroidales bacterium]|nr:ATP-binding protein [Bacteroidales bacterium]
MSELWIEISVAAVALVALCLALYYWRRARSAQRKLRYVFDATLSQDFSYRFNSADELNVTLNQIVDHLHALTDKARNTDAYYGLILDQTVTGIIIVDDADNVTHCNAAALRLLDMDVLTHLSQIHRQRPTVGTAIAMNLPSCSIDSKSLSLAMTETTMGSQHLRIIAINDISRPLQSKEDESWVKLTRVLTHEIMNSLTPVTSITDTLIQDNSISKEKLHESLLTISACNRSLMQFVANFRKFTIIPEPKPAAFEVLPFLRGIVALGQGLNPVIHFALEVDHPELMLYADQGMIHQLLVNLVKNAVEAPSKEIRISAQQNPDESVSVIVENDGPTIPADIADHIFVPFFTTRPDGSGIGLSLSRRYAIANGGSLTLTRLPRTRFTLTL